MDKILLAILLLIVSYLLYYRYKENYDSGDIDPSIRRSVGGIAGPINYPYDS